jgi:hypothetical protein
MASTFTWLDYSEVGLDAPPAHVAFPWEHPHFATFPAHIREQLTHGQNFSEIIQGAAFLYNLLLAEKSQWSDAIDDYHELLNRWDNMISNRHTALATWDLNRMWELLLSGGARVAFSTRTFVNNWVTLVRGLDNPATIVENKHAQDLIRQREQAIKGQKARLHNQRALELWQGASGVAPLDYRWSTAQRIIRDILEGLPQEEPYASPV